jgi:hypothetical protein
MNPDDFALDDDLPDFPAPAPNPYAPPRGFWARLKDFLRDIRDPFDVEE